MEFEFRWKTVRKMSPWSWARFLSIAFGRDPLFNVSHLPSLAGTVQTQELSQIMETGDRESVGLQVLSGRMSYYSWES